MTELNVESVLTNAANLIEVAKKAYSQGENYFTQSVALSSLAIYGELRVLIEQNNQILNKLEMIIQKK